MSQALLPEVRLRGRVPVVDAAAVLVLLVAAAALRAGPLGPGSLWLDDAWPAMVTRASSLREVLLVGLTAPGFVALLRVVLDVGGPAPAVAQALPFACGVLAVPGVYLVARQARLGRVAALVAAGVLLASPVHLTYSTRVKQYTLEVLFGLLVTSAALAVLRRPDRAGRWALLVTAAVAGTVVSSVVAVPATAALGAAGLCALRAAAQREACGPRALRLALASGAVWTTVVVAWWLLVVRPATNPALAEYWSGYFTLSGWRGVLAGLAPVPAEVTAGALVLAAVAVLLRGAPEAVLLLSPPAVAAALAVARLAPLGGGRTDLYLYPSLCLTLAVGTAAATRAVRPALAVLPAVACVAGLVLATPGPEPYPQEDVAPLVAALDAQARPGDVVLVYSATRWGHAYATRWPVQLRDADLANGFDARVIPPAGIEVVVLPPQRESPEGHRPVVAAGTRGAGRVWLLTSHTSPDVAVVGEALSASGFRLAGAQVRPGAELSLWLAP